MDRPLESLLGLAPPEPAPREDNDPTVALYMPPGWSRFHYLGPAPKGDPGTGELLSFRCGRAATWATVREGHALRRRLSAVPFYATNVCGACRYELIADTEGLEGPPLFWPLERFAFAISDPRANY